eukprot:360023-Chlamydomonas_euryale.AAC.5
MEKITTCNCMHRFGVESADRLEWRNWTPGTEYVKSYSLKNVSSDKTLQITYKQTASKAFSMDFPEPFKLRPGMSQSLKVSSSKRLWASYADACVACMCPCMRRGPCTKYVPRPQVAACHACRGRGRPDMHDANAQGRRPRGIYVHACPRPRAGRGRGRCDSPRSEAESSIFCARMTLPRFHKW